MKDVRVDEQGEFHCWKCGGKNFTLKRTVRSKVLMAPVFIAAPLMTKKKLKCQSCGEFNDVGNAKPMKAAPAVVVASSQPDEVAALWAPDPTGHHELRYWNGTAWTEHVSTDDKQSTDPLAAEVERSSVDDVAAQIRKLAELRDDGLLTDEEFAQQKAKLLT